MTNSHRTRGIVLICLSHGLLGAGLFLAGMCWERSQFWSKSLTTTAATTIDVLLDPCGAASGILHVHKNSKTPWTAERHLDIWKREFGSMLVDYALAVSHLKSTNVPVEEHRTASTRYAETALQTELLALYPEPKPGITSIELRINHPLNPEHLTNRQIIQRFIQTYSQLLNSETGVGSGTPANQPDIEYRFAPIKRHETKSKP